MKKISLLSALLMLGLSTTQAAPLRVALIDVEDQTGMKSDDRLGGTISAGAMAEKALFSLAKQMGNNPEMTLIDRRDFISQIERMAPKDGSDTASARPSFIRAAQALRTDIVLRGILLGMSTGKQIVNQGGYSSDLSTLTVRVGLQALDPVDGAVIATSDGASKRQFRQTDTMQTVMSEDDVMSVMDEAIAQALPALTAVLDKREAKNAARPKHKISVKTTSDPALLEVDGILVGSTPLADFEVYQGDHVITISKAGHQPITKRILVEADMSLEAPILRQDLSAEELYEVYKNSNLFLGAQPGIVIQGVK